MQGVLDRGKTTLLNALSCEIPHGERIITIEDSAELKFDSHPHVIRLESRDASIEGSGEVTIRDLVKNALRMASRQNCCRRSTWRRMHRYASSYEYGGMTGSLTTLHAGR